MGAGTGRYLGWELEGLHVNGKYRIRSMQYTCSRHAAWDSHKGAGCC